MPRNQIATIAGKILKISIIYSFNCLTWRCSNTLSTSYSAAISSLPAWRLCLPQQLGEYKKSLSNNIPLNMSVSRHFSVWFCDIMMLRQGLGYFSRNGGLSHGKPVHSVLCEVLSHNAMEHWVNLTVLLGNNIIIKKTLSLTKKAEMLCYWMMRVNVYCMCVFDRLVLMVLLMLTTTCDANQGSKYLTVRVLKILSLKQNVNQYHSCWQSYQLYTLWYS